MKKIAFFMPKLDIGGIERVFITYANELVNRGFTVDFVLCKTGGTLQTLLCDEVNIYDLGGLQLRNAFFPLRKYLKANKPDYLYTGSNYQNLLCTIVCLGVKTKVIISQHNYFDIDVKASKFSVIEKIAMRLIYPLADCIIAVSDGIRNYLIGSVGLKDTDVVYLPNPIDFAYTTKRSFEKADLELPAKYIVFIGRLTQVKNLQLLLESFDKSRIEDQDLVIVGDGECMNNLRIRTSLLSKKDKIHFIGKVSNPLPYLAKASCLVLCSFSEALPTILLEALCLKVPIASTPTKGALEIIANVPGCYISKSFSDVDEFSRILELASSVIHFDNDVYLRKYDKKVVVDTFVNLLCSL